MDQGIIPAIAPTLKDYFGFNSTAIGSLGSCIYLGATAGKLKKQSLSFPTIMTSSLNLCRQRPGYSIPGPCAYKMGPDHLHRLANDGPVRIHLYREVGMAGFHKIPLRGLLGRPGHLLACLGRRLRTDQQKDDLDDPNYHGCTNGAPHWLRHVSPCHHIHGKLVVGVLHSHDCHGTPSDNLEFYRRQLH